MSDVESRLRELVIETPSWGYGDSGTRFGVFPQPGRPRDVFERIDDAAEVHRLTGTAGAVALHFPWDAVDDYGALREHIEARGLRVGAVNPNLFQDPDYKLGSVTHPDARVREKAVGHLLECLEIATRARLDARSRCGSPTARTTPARTTCASAAAGCSTRSGACTPSCPPSQELLVEYKLFEPAFYATDLADWGSALLTCLKLGERARVLVDLGHHAQGVNIEQIVAFLADEGRLGGFHFNNRKYADDDLIVGSVNPFELFLIFVELAAGEHAAAAHDRPVAQRRAQGRGDGAERRQPAGGVRQGAARRPRGAARGAAGGRRARRPRAAARRLQDRRPPAVRAGQAAARRGGGPDRRAARVRLRRARRRARDRTRPLECNEHRHAARRPRRGPVARRGRRRTTRSRSSCSPPTCSAPTAPCRTSAAATRRPREPLSITPAARPE